MSNRFSVSGLTEINDISDIIKVNDFVFKTVNWSDKPCSVKHDLRDIPIEEIITKFNTNKIGGWCGLNAEILHSVLYHLNVNSTGYNFGLPESGITHIGINVEFNGKKYFMDPYFGRYYSKEDGIPIDFDTMKELIENKEFNNINSIYANETKCIIRGDKIEEYTPQMLEKSVLGGFELKGYSEIMNEKFGDDNFLNLFPLEIK